MEAGLISGISANNQKNDKKSFNKTTRMENRKLVSLCFDFQNSCELDIDVSIMCVCVCVACLHECVCVCVLLNISEHY